MHKSNQLIQDKATNIFAILKPQGKILAYKLCLHNLQIKYSQQAPYKFHQPDFPMTTFLIVTWSVCWLSFSYKIKMCFERTVISL